MCTDTGRSTHTQCGCVWAWVPIPLVSAPWARSSYCVSVFYWQSLSPAKRGYKYSPRIANRTPMPFVLLPVQVVRTFVMVMSHQNFVAWIFSPRLQGIQCPHLDEFMVSLLPLEKDSWKSWPAVRWPRVLSGRKWLTDVFEGFTLQHISTHESPFWKFEA